MKIELKKCIICCCYYWLNDPMAHKTYCLDCLETSIKLHNFEYQEFEMSDDEIDEIEEHEQSILDEALDDLQRENMKGIYND